MTNQVYPSLPEDRSGETFDEVVLPHMDAAHRLARWLMRNQHDAEDAVQEASLRAFRYFRTFTGGNGRAWFLRIVRNTCHGWHGRGQGAVTDLFDEERHSTDDAGNNPDTLLLQARTASALERAIGALPDRSRELLVRRELDGLSYRELADAMGVPMGTVMSGLSRARHALRDALSDDLDSPADRKRTRRRGRPGGRGAGVRDAPADNRPIGRFTRVTA